MDKSGKVWKPPSSELCGMRKNKKLLQGSTLQMVAPDTGQLINNLSMSEQQTEGTAPESSTHFNLPPRPGLESKQKQSEG